MLEASNRLTVISKLMACWKALWNFKDNSRWIQ